MERTDYLDAIKDHYESHWKRQASHKRWLATGQVERHPENFSVLEFSPTPDSPLWIYATCGMSYYEDSEPLETFLYAPSQDAGNVELLTMLAVYHRELGPFGLHHRVTIGRVWAENSLCEKGYFALPYMEGPELEWLCLEPQHIQTLWFVPITEAEAAYVDEAGIEGLEQKFEDVSFQYWNPSRSSAV